MLHICSSSRLVRKSFSGFGIETDEISQQTAVEQTKAVFAPLREKIAVAVERLEEQLAMSEQLDASGDEVQQAKEALAKAKET
jgi:hypothetical protein